MKFAIVPASLLLAVCSLGPATAQDLARSVWDGVFTTEQAERGASTYNLYCSACHGPSPALQRFEGQPLSEVHTFIRTMMPDGSPGTLSGQEYSDVLSYLLQYAGMPAGDAELPTLSRGMTDIEFTLVSPTAAASGTSDSHKALLDEH